LGAFPLSPSISKQALKQEGADANAANEKDVPGNLTEAHQREGEECERLENLKRSHHAAEPMIAGLVVSSPL
jgi:hypothetical protein